MTTDNVQLQRTIEDVLDELNQAKKEVAEMAGMVKVMAQAAIAAGMLPEFPEIAHNMALKYALADYEGALSIYGCLEAEYREMHSMATRAARAAR